MANAEDEELSRPPSVSVRGMATMPIATVSRCVVADRGQPSISLVPLAGVHGQSDDGQSVISHRRLSAPARCSATTWAKMFFFCIRPCHRRPERCGVTQLALDAVVPVDPRRRTVARFPCRC